MVTPRTAINNIYIRYYYIQQQQQQQQRQQQQQQAQQAQQKQQRQQRQRKKTKTNMTGQVCLSSSNGVGLHLTPASTDSTLCQRRNKQIGGADTKQE